MRSLLICIPLFLSFFMQASSAGEERPIPPRESADFQVLKKRDFIQKTTRDGVFVPAVYEEIQIWPDEFRGEILVLDALPHGTFVNEGERIATLSMKPLEEGLLQAERQVRSAELNLRNCRERAEIAEVSAKAASEQGRIELESARRVLEGWEKHEIEFSKRGAALNQQATDNYIEDQQDELDQLEAMYRDDELVDATEEVVLKRSRRDLARTRNMSALQKDRRAYQVEFDEAEQTRRKRELVQAKQIAMEQLMKTQKIDRRVREDSIVQAQEALEKAVETCERLKADRAMLELRAGRSGMLLHGSEKDYFPGSVPPRYHRGSRLPMHTPVFLIAEPDRVKLAIDIPESDIRKYRTGAAARVEITCAPDVEPVGTLDVERFPQAQSAAGPENKYRAVIEFEKRLTSVLPGMRGIAHLEAEPLRDVFVVPRCAVQDMEGSPYCRVASPDSDDFKRVDVETGASSATEIVVSGDLTEGWKVLLGAPKKP